MRQFRCLRVACHLGGTLERPRVQLRSNLGPELAAAISRVAQQQLQKRREELAAALQQQVDSQLAEFHRLAAQQQEELLRQIEQGNLAARQIDQLMAQFSSRLPISQLPGQLLQGLSPHVPARF